MARRRDKWIALLIIVVIIGIIPTCDMLLFPGPLDITNDSRYAFKPIVGTLWKAKVPFALLDSSKTLSIRLSSDFDVEQYHRALADPSYRDGGIRIVAILPIGTLFRIDYLENTRGSTGFIIPHGSLTSGSFAGRDITLWDVFVPNDFTAPGKSLPKTWTVNPDNFEKP